MPKPHAVTVERAPRTVVAIIYPGFAPLDLAGPLQAFGAVSEGYTHHVLSIDGGAVESDCSGVTFQSLPISAAPVRVDTLLIAGGQGARDARRNDDLIGSIARLATNARRVASVCVGAYLVAEAGLLEGRRVATHWRACSHFQSRYPKVTVDSDAIYVRDGNIWSSAGITAGIDLALALIEDDHGRREAMRVARELVMYLRRPGGQSQFSTVLEAQSSAQDRFSDLLAWMRSNLQAPLTVETLASQVSMSERSFTRHFHQAVGVTPAKAVEAMRVEAACSALEDGAAIIRAAQCAGFADEQRMRRAFVRRLKVTPAEWRARFYPDRDSHVGGN